MKTRCKHCLDWIMSSRGERRWFHLSNGGSVCGNNLAVATRDPMLPLVDLTDEDRQRLQP